MLQTSLIVAVPALVTLTAALYIAGSELKSPKMLQTFLIVAVPALVTLTAALYVLHRVSRAREEMHRPPHFQTRPGFTSDNDDAANRRSRSRPSSRAYSNTSRGAAGDSTVTSRRTGGGSESGPYKGDCVVCFEESNIVQLYPCLHRSLCEECVIKIVSSNRRICPLCRTRIQGYSDDF